MSSHSYKNLSVIGIGAGLFALSGVASAQEGEGLAEIIVTAQKRAENLQNVPIALTAVTSAQINERRISSVVDLNSMAPNLVVGHYDESNTAPQISIRGNQGGSDQPGAPSPVGMYLDGVYIGAGVGTVLDMVDMERIEVLRGPQGTLFGRNTEAGAVSFVSKKPSGTFAGAASVDYGRFNDRILKLTLDLPKIGIASASLAVRSERRDGWMSQTSGTQPLGLGNRNNDGARLAVNLDFSDKFTGFYSFDASRYDENSNPAQLYHIDPTFLNGLLTPYAHTDRQSTVDYDTTSFDQTKVLGHSLIFTWDLAEHATFKSISAYRRSSRFDAFDLDKTPVPIINNLPGTMEFQQWTQELQLTGSSGKLTYATGLYYFGNTGRIYGQVNTYFFDLQENEQDSAQRSEGYAGYGQVDYALTDALTLTGGYRYSYEHQNATVYAIDPYTSNQTSQTSGAATSVKGTPLLTLSYKLTPNLNTYAKYSQGFKAGFAWPGNVSSGYSANVNPETSEAYEAGVKFTSEDGRVRLNVAAFDTKIHDMQLYVYKLTSGVANSVGKFNAGAATQRGVEVEANWRPLDRVTLQASYGYLHAKFDEFIDGGVNVADNRSVPRAPKETLSLNADFKLYDGNYGRLTQTIGYTYTAAQYMYTYQLASSGPGYNPNSAVAGNTMASSSGVLNARLALSEIPLGNGDQTLDVALWGKNLTDFSRPVDFIDFGPGYMGNMRTAYFMDPRTYGINVTLHWH